MLIIYANFDTAINSKLKKSFSRSSALTTIKSNGAGNILNSPSGWSVASDKIGVDLPIKSQVPKIAQVVLTVTLTQGESKQSNLLGRSAFSQGLRANSIWFINPGYSPHYRHYRLPKGAIVRVGVFALQHSNQIISRSFYTSMSQSLHKSTPPLAKESGMRLSQLNPIYNLSSPIFKELLTILNNEPLNNKTQLKIEKFLLNQAEELNTKKIASGEENKYNKFSNAVILEFTESKKILAKLIKNYKTNLKTEESNDLSSFSSRIFL